MCIAYRLYLLESVEDYIQTPPKIFMTALWLLFSDIFLLTFEKLYHILHISILQK